MRRLKAHFAKEASKKHEARFSAQRPYKKIKWPGRLDSEGGSFMCGLREESTQTAFRSQVGNSPQLIVLNRASRGTGPPE